MRFCFNRCDGLRWVSNFFSLLVATSIFCPSAVGHKVTPLQLSVWTPVQPFPDHWDVVGIRINMAYGRVEDLVGIDVGLGVNKIKEEGWGIQASGLLSSCGLTKEDVKRVWSIFKGNSWADAEGAFKSGEETSPDGKPTWSDRSFNGFQFSAISNVAAALNGLQVSSIVNMAGRTRGIQIGTLNYAEEMSGIQIGLGSNRVVGDMRGVQIQGCVMTNPMFLYALVYMISSVGGDMTGVQSGVICTSGGLYGLQDGMLLNFAEKCRGVQLSLINVGQDVRGLQIGVVNYAKNMKGLQLGVVNIIRESPLKFFPLVNLHF